MTSQEQPAPGPGQAMAKAEGTTSEALSARPWGCDYPDLVAHVSYMPGRHLGLHRRPVNLTLPPGSRPTWHAELQAIFPSFVSLKPLEGPLGWESGLLRAFLWPGLITGLRSLQTKFSLELWLGGMEGGRKGEWAEGRRGGLRSHKQSLASAGPGGARVLGSGRGSCKLCGPLL